MVDNSVDNKENNSFQTSWFSSFIGDSSNIVENLEQIRSYAYGAFDKLDADKNGFIEQEELIKALTDHSLSERERSFVDFLISNREQIADAFDENDERHAQGISRKDIESYFDLISTLL